jgi:hypothetical protein
MIETIRRKAVTIQWLSASKHCFYVSFISSLVFFNNDALSEALSETLSHSCGKYSFCAAVAVNDNQRYEGFSMLTFYTERIFTTRIYVTAFLTATT